MRFFRGILSGKRVLVTGGTGFIGGRLIEKLVLECNAEVCVLVRNFARACRIARFPVKMVHGDITNLADVKRAANGCEFIFHCAYGNEGDIELQRLVNVEGAKNVLEAALHGGAKRVVHLSTYVVYGWAKTDGDLDESAKKRYSDNVYSDSKLDAEKIVLDYMKKYAIPVVVLQPTVVYGPFARPWTTNIIQKFKTGRMILVNNGEGLCNAVYVDDVVNAILLSAVGEKAVGEVFLISGEMPVTWREFYGRFERMLGISGTVSMSAAEAEAYYFKNQRKVKGIIKETLDILRKEPLIRERILLTREIVALRGIIRTLLPEQVRYLLKRRIMGNHRTDQSQDSVKPDKTIHPMHPLLVHYHAAKTRVRIDKAKRMLNYQPTFNFESGMALTEQWARWANLL